MRSGLQSLQSKLLVNNHTVQLTTVFIAVFFF